MPVPNDEWNTIERWRRIFWHSDDKGEAKKGEHCLIVLNKLQEIGCHQGDFYLTTDFNSLTSLDRRSFSFCKASS